MSTNNKKEIHKAANKANNGQVNKNGKDIGYNSMSSLIFTPFKVSKKIVANLSLLSVILIVIFGWRVNFETKDLKEISQFALNIVLVIGAMGIAIFAIPFNKNEINNKIDKKEIMLRFIGDFGILISGSIFCYVLSFIIEIIPEWSMNIPGLNIDVSFPKFIVKTFCILAMIFIANAVSQTFATLVAYFNIRD
ncbi:hypothetical protein [Clostridium beijerinckii]|uniref:hypothetical protein n=1 Tax=Clostridium beijerinckii TaxID=1520 RepID=UPI002330E5AE|nr:hypothetical protein [Clostridium beijerinckii]